LLVAVMAGFASTFFGGCALEAATFYHYPMPTDISPQEAKIGKAPLTSIYLSALSCFFFMQKCPFLFFSFSFSEAYWIFLRFQYDIAAHEIPAQYVYNACDFKSI